MHWRVHDPNFSISALATFDMGVPFQDRALGAERPEPRSASTIRNARSRTTSARSRHREMLDLDRVGSLLGLPEVISQLQLQPAFRQAPECLRQPNGHVRGKFPRDH
jgi:hypothetical protein